MRDAYIRVKDLIKYIKSDSRDGAYVSVRDINSIERVFIDIDKEETND